LIQVTFAEFYPDLFYTVYLLENVMSLLRPTLLLVLSTLLLGACSPSQPTPGVGPDGTLLTLSGQLVTQGQTVRLTVSGLPPVTTDAQGSFRIPGVKIPYSIRADFPRSGSDGGTQAVMVEDLTSSDLTALKTLVRIMIPKAPIPNPPESAVLRGQLIGMVDPFKDAMVYLTSVTSSASYGLLFKNTRNFEVPVRSDFPPSGQGTLHALQSDGDYTSLVQSYSRYGEKHFTVPSVGVLEGQDIALDFITTGQLKLKIGGLVGAQPAARVKTEFRTSTNEGGISLSGSSTPLETTVSLPRIPGAQYALWVSLDEVSSGPLYRTSVTRSQLESLPLTLEVNPPPFLEWISPSLNQPVDPAATDTLRWGEGSGLTSLTLDESVSGSNDRRRLFTALVQKNHFNLKDYGFTLQAGHTYYVDLTHLGGLSYTRALSFYDYDKVGIGYWPLGEFNIQSVQLNFKTRP